MQPDMVFMNDDSFKRSHFKEFLSAPTHGSQYKLLYPLSIRLEAFTDSTQPIIAGIQNPLGIRDRVWVLQQQILKNITRIKTILVSTKAHECDLQSSSLSTNCSRLVQFESLKQNSGKLLLLKLTFVVFS
eukprot:TRINITY_DN14483_c0_g1_i3.p3 TRINITY_DN14483_c0_g1~~TRINITY_DN14483_c0_g1_i3.p3  ORF type:complete len:130 (-),score=0.43 TRINITY_DN14483_c0_g1_i3:67-456(-)